MNKFFSAGHSGLILKEVSKILPSTRGADIFLCFIALLNLISLRLVKYVIRLVEFVQTYKM